MRNKFTEENLIFLKKINEQLLWDVSQIIITAAAITNIGVIVIVIIVIIDSVSVIG